MTREHVPLKSTWNNQLLVEKDMRRHIRGQDVVAAMKSGKGRHMQPGRYGWWTCKDCNGLMNREYAPAYRDFALGQGGATPHTIAERPITCRPLRVLKQIVGFFCCQNSRGHVEGSLPGFDMRWDELQRFVRDPALTQLPDDYRIFALRCYGGGRFCGFQKAVSFEADRVVITGAISEVALNPLGFIMTFGNCPPLRPEIGEVTDWKDMDDSAPWTGHATFPPLFIPRTERQYPGHYLSLGEWQAAFERGEW